MTSPDDYLAIHAGAAIGAIAPRGQIAVAGPDDRQRWRYEVADADALQLYDLHLLVNDPEGLDWDSMEQRLSPLPTD